MDTYSLYEQLYYRELELRDRIDSRVPTVLVIVLALAGWIAYVVDGLLSIPWSTMGGIALAIQLFGIIELVVAVVYLVKAWYGYTYWRLPLTERLEQHRQELNNYYGQKSSVPDVSTEFEKDIKLYFIECSGKNAAANDKKADCLHKAFGWIITSAAFTFVAFVLLKTAQTMAQNIIN